MKVDINTQNRLKTARIKMSKTCPSHKANKTWPMVRLGDVCDEIKNRIQSSKVAVGEYVTTDNMVKDRGGIVQAEYVPSDVGLVEYRKGDVLIANIRPYLKKIWLADHDGGCSSDVVVFRTNTDGLSSEYLYSVLSQDAYFEYVMQKPRGTKMPRGDRDWMKEFRFPLPPLSEQHGIVARLERELAAVEKMKKGFEALAETAKQEFKAELKEVFEGLKSGGAEIGTDGTNGTVETRRLGEICETITDGDHQPPPKSSQGVPFLVISNVASGRISFENTRFVPMAYYEAIQENRKPRKGDVLLTVTGSYGIPVLVETNETFCFQRHIALIRASRLDSKFLAYALLSPDSKRYFDLVATGAAQKTIGLASIRAMSIPFPSLSVQRQIVSHLSAAKARAEKLEAKAREGVAVCETMRKAILKEAFE